MPYNGNCKLSEFCGLKTTKNNIMDLKKEILEVLETNIEWLSDNDVILKSDFNNVADEIVKLCNLQNVSVAKRTVSMEELMVYYGQSKHIFSDSVEQILADMLTER